MPIPTDMTAGCIHRTNDFGDIEILKYRKYADVDVRFIDTGTILKSQQASNIRAGSLKDYNKPVIHGVGFMGYGPHRSHEHCRLSKAYSCWRAMLERCYAPNRSKKNKQYENVTVCNEWHNFQNFAKWYKDNYPAGCHDIHIDKDMKIKGNRIYSPEGCSLVPAAVNIAFSHAKDWILTTPRGDVIFITNLKIFCDQNGLQETHMNKVAAGKLLQHKGWKCRKA